MAMSAEVFIVYTGHLSLEGFFWGTFNWEEAPRQTQNRLEKLRVPPDLGTPQDDQGAAGEREISVFFFLDLLPSDLTLDKRKLLFF